MFHHPSPSIIVWMNRSNSAEHNQIMFNLNCLWNFCVAWKFLSSLVFCLHHHLYWIGNQCDSDWATEHRRIAANTAADSASTAAACTWIQFSRHRNQIWHSTGKSYLIPPILAFVSTIKTKLYIPSNVAWNKKLNTILNTAYDVIWIFLLKVSHLFVHLMVLILFCGRVNPHAHTNTHTHTFKIPDNQFNSN